MSHGDCASEKIVVQVLRIKKLLVEEEYENQSLVERERFRIFLSDGQFYTRYCMLEARQNHLVTTHSLMKFSLIEIKKYTLHDLKSDKMAR